MTVFLIAALCLAAWIVGLYLRPFGPCPHCNGKRVVMRGTSKKPRPVTCHRCNGVGRRQRPGSKTVHQLARRVRKYRQMQRRQRAAAATAHPEE